MEPANQRLKMLALNDSGFIFDPTTGQSFTTNETGLDIIRLMREGRSKAEIFSFLEEAYDAPKDLIYKDAMQFLSQLKTYRLVDDI